MWREMGEGRWGKVMESNGRKEGGGKMVMEGRWRKEGGK